MCPIRESRARRVVNIYTFTAIALAPNNMEEQQIIEQQILTELRKILATTVQIRQNLDSSLELINGTSDDHKQHMESVVVSSLSRLRHVLEALQSV